MRAALRSGLLGYTSSFVSDYAPPLFDESCTKQSKDVYVKVKAAAINPVDYKLPRALGGDVFGIDFCGTIEKVGSDVDGKYKVGDEVFGTCSSGSLADYCIANSDKIAKVPKDDSWDPSECAALPIAYMSALQSLRIGNITPQDTENDDSTNEQKSVLIIGASGGCGVAGTQLCKAMGVGRIVGICSSRNSDFVKGLGATEIICYDDEKELKAFYESNKGKFDCVYDAATNSGGGEDYWTMSISLLKNTDIASGKQHGEYVALNGSAGKWIRAFTGKQKEHETIMMMKSNSADLDMVISLLSKIKAKPITNIIPFSEEGMENGMKQLKGRRTKGKIVFDLR